MIISTHNLWIALVWLESAWVTNRCKSLSCYSQLIMDYFFFTLHLYEHTARFHQQRCDCIQWMWLKECESHFIYELQTKTWDSDWNISVWRLLPALCWCKPQSRPRVDLNFISENQFICIQLKPQSSFSASQVSEPVIVPVSKSDEM